MKHILVLADHQQMLTRFRALLRRKKIKQCRFHFAFSYHNEEMMLKYSGKKWIKPLDIKNFRRGLVHNIDMILSLHCRQIFPEQIVKTIRCVNVHPGLNPYNRGWYPNVFSMINGLPCGATIFEMDEKIDHGPIIAQKKVDREMSDTSLTYYQKIMDAEMELLDKYIEKIVAHDYSTFIPEEGNVNTENDFANLCQINPANKDTFGNHINLLRAMTHGGFKNAYITHENGEKIFLKIVLERENKKTGNTRKK